MEHFTEYAIIITNLMLFIVTVMLIIVTAIDNRAMAKIAAIALTKIAPKKAVEKIAKREVYQGRHEA